MCGLARLVCFTNILNHVPPLHYKPDSTSSLFEETKKFQKAIISWFQKNGKSYPWRDTHDPYAVLVSEIMLQQTTLKAVLGNRRFERFLSRFPDVRSLAKATEAEVLAEWEGLGYYRRARSLHACAKAIMEKHAGIFPTKHADILGLPGIGRYTAGAVASFAFNQSQAIVDANVARVLTRLLDYKDTADSPKGQKDLWLAAEQLVPESNARAFNSGLMELGQTLCSITNPDCTNCPVSAFCKTRSPESLPVKKQKKAFVSVDEHVLFVMRANGDILLSQQCGERRKGLWMLPVRTSEDVCDFPIILTQKYTITHHRVTLYIHECSANGFVLENNDSIHEQWIARSNIKALPMPSPFRKALAALEPFS